MHPLSDRDRAIERALRGSAGLLERDPHGGWRFTVSNGALTRLHARIVDEDWLVATTAHATPGGSWWPLLQLNAGLNGSARLARAAAGGLEVRSEIFLGSDPAAERASSRGDASTAERVAAMCEDIVSVTHGTLEVRADDMADAPSSQPDTDRLVTLCVEAGWAATPRAAGEVQVALDSGAAAFQATLALDATARLRAAVPLAASSVEPGPSQEAIALLLIEAGAELRTVKGCVVRQAGADVAGVAVAAERLPASVASIDRALAALSVACRSVGREVQALQDPHLACAYLMLRHPHGAARRVSLTCSHHTEDTPCLQLPS